VHSKVSIFDDREAIVSSANLNGRSLRWDTEAGLHLTRAAHVTDLRNRIFAHWMPDLGVAPEAGVAPFFAAWKRAVEDDMARPPEQRSTRLLPYDETTARRFGENVALVPNEIV
jgi:phospholipase D1/2